MRFVDINAGDLPTVKTAFGSFTYQNAQHTDVTATLSALQIADITAVEAQLTVVPDPRNNNGGFATWTYNVADSGFDFLAAGETLTLTYLAEVDSNYAPNNLQDPASRRSRSRSPAPTTFPSLPPGQNVSRFRGAKPHRAATFRPLGRHPPQERWHLPTST